MRKLGIAVFAVGAVVVLSEVVVRASRITDFPLYNSDPVLGYVPAPNQSGAVFGTNDWVFNELSMGTANSFAPNSWQDILLIGDSIVLVDLRSLQRRHSHNARRQHADGETYI
jgi:hypothetical protein